MIHDDDRRGGESPIVATRARQHARLAAIDADRAAGSSTVELLFERARLLDALGRNADAQRAFVAVLAVDTAHAGALNELGVLLERTGFSTAAHTVFQRAVSLHPDDPIGHGNLGSWLLDRGDVDGARSRYEIALRLDPGHVAANACLAIVLLRLGDNEGAQRHAAIGFRSAATAWPYRGSGVPIPVVVIHSALGGNVSTLDWIDDRTFAVWTLVAEFSADVALPPHALVINAIGDADRCQVALHIVQTLLMQTTAPVINAPAHVLATGRAENACRFADIPGIVVPRVATFARRELATLAETPAVPLGFAWPVVLRAPGYHTGEYCELVADEHECAAAAARLPGDELLVIDYIDVRRPDDSVRKYRVMVVGGELFPLHLAISTTWKVHYFSAAIAERADYRAEEAAFLADMSGVLGPTAVATLHAIAQRLRLDYGGIDFGLDRAGRVVFFEANATMIVPLPDDDPKWAYRRAAVARIRAAMRTLLHEAARIP